MRSVSFGISVSEPAAQQTQMSGDIIASFHQQPRGVDGEHTFGLEELFGLHMFPYLRTHEKQSGTGVIDDMAYINRIEIRQYGHYYSPICDDGHIYLHPFHRIATA